ncbi:hypothetical protein LCGC14_2338040 [marine sediment metagenome]|uniref:Uncharacterized protein n=1 Tax=marine sediment metagenome TaxID=412755 RepID=A0A0F9CDP0_9ZZZZ
MLRKLGLIVASEAKVEVAGRVDLTSELTDRREVIGNHTALRYFEVRAAKGEGPRDPVDSTMGPCPPGSRYPESGLRHLTVVEWRIEQQVAPGEWIVRVKYGCVELLRALAAFVEAYRNVEPGAATPALDDAYDLAKEALGEVAEAEGG